MATGRGLKSVLAAAGTLLGLGLIGMLLRGGDTRIAPDFVVTDLQGNAVRLSADRGKVVLVNFWATWCAPCREEMPSMQRLAERMKGKDFALLAVSEDADRDAVENFVREQQIRFPVLLDPNGEAASRYGVWGYPETFVLNRAGEIVERVIGPRAWDAPAEVARIEQLLAAGDPKP